MWRVDVSRMCVEYVEKEHIILHASSKHEQICLAGVVTGCSLVITCLVRAWIRLTKSAKWVNHSICEMTDWTLTQNKIPLKEDWPQLTLPTLEQHTAHKTFEMIWKPISLCFLCLLWLPSLHSPRSLNRIHIPMVPLCPLLKVSCGNLSIILYSCSVVWWWGG